MDLSSLSDQDLMALKSGDLSKVSNDGLMKLKGAASAPAQEPKSVYSSIGDTLRSLAGGARDVAAGAVRGAGSIGATILAPVDAAARALNDGQPISIGGIDIAGQDRRGLMDSGLQTMTGADPNSLAYKGGKLAGEIAGTAGAGGFVANGVRALPAAAALARAPAVANAVVNAVNKAEPVLSAVATGGMRAGGLTGVPGMAARVAGGAINGGVSAAMVNPSDAGTGAAVGAALPPVVWGIGKAGGFVGNTVRSAIQSQQAKTGGTLGQALELNTPEAVRDAIAQLRAAEELVPGSTPTVAQALQTPQAGILQRVVQGSAGGNALNEQLAAQNAARLQALERVSPTAPGGYETVRADVGESISRSVVPEERAISQRISDMYEGIDPNGTAEIPLPVVEMQAAVDRYLGRGSFGRNADASTAVRTAQDVAAPVAPEQVPGIVDAAGVPFRQPAAPTPSPATWDEVNKLRSSIGEAWQRAKDNGEKQAAAALDSQRRALDAAIEQFLPPDMLAQFLEANTSHAAKIARFHEGPQAAIFQTRNGQPLVQGGEVAARFWGNRPGIAEDVQSFRRLIDDNPDLLGRFRSMVTTQGAGTADAAGRLGTKFAKWVESMQPGLERAFDPQEVDMLNRIAQDIRRAEQAAAAGMAKGSNTYQNANNALALGLLDSPGLSAIVNRMPMIGSFAGMGLDGLRETARRTKARNLAAALADAQAGADALERGGFPAGRGISVDPRIQALFYRAAPVTAADR